MNGYYACCTRNIKNHHLSDQSATTIALIFQTQIHSIVIHKGTKVILSTILRSQVSPPNLQVIPKIS